MKELFLVCIGSFFGGGARYIVGKVVQSWRVSFPVFDRLPVAFPWGTMAVNVIGCFLIGLLSGLSLGGQISSTTKLVLVTGFCGGFTTFSTFMNENLLLGRDGAMLSAVLYTLLSLALGLIAVIVGYQIVK
ncbi:fluoride efflux transporter CrcB [Prevotella sp. P6B4]|uniref:fluoride efflux transporter CrcB n=1 Tax=Prevotella sp. P6B4 TaxID=1410614 RepID=UPI0004909378|nr:fluoride efflux transporter CrcB [Prevotella sp. P6B4]